MNNRMQPITYAGRPAAMAGEYRFWYVHSIDLLPDGHPTKRVVAFMCVFARDVIAGEAPGPYTDERAARFAREALLPGGEFIALAHEEDLALALHFRVPLETVVARRAELACVYATASVARHAPR